MGLVQSMAPGAPRETALAALAPVLAQVAAARLARRELRRHLGRMEREQRGGDHYDEDKGGERGGHAHGHGGAAGAGAGSSRLGGRRVGHAIDDDEEEEDDDSSAASEESDYESDFTAAPEEGDGADDNGDDVAMKGVGAADLSPARLFPHVNGTALFSVVCLMNHSCAPNALVVYGEGSHSAVVIAQTDVAAGEELCINYIDVEEEEVAVRRAELAHYGFVCACARCGKA